MARKSTTLTYNGETLTLRQWAHRLGCSHQVLRERLRLGWSVKRTLTTPAPCIRSIAADEAFDTLVLSIDHALRVYQTASGSVKHDQRGKLEGHDEVRAGGSSKLSEKAI